MNKPLAGKVALVTGGSRGIGASIARQFGSAGAKVLVNYFSDSAAAQQVVKEVTAAGSEAIAIAADARTAEGTRLLVDTAVAEFGALDIVVGNASIRFPIAKVVDLEWAEVEKKLLGEVGAAFHLAQAAAPVLADSDWGRLILLGSMMATTPTPSFSAHGMSKGALASLARYLAVELGPAGISTTVVVPGTTLTDAISHMDETTLTAIRNATPTGLNTTPDDVAEVVTAVACAATRQLNGSVIPVNGGLVVA